MKPLPRSLSRFFNRLLDHRNSIWLLLIALVLLPVFSAWIGDILKDLLNSCFDDDGCHLAAGDGWLLIAAVVLAIFSLMHFYRLGRELIAPRVVEQLENPEAHPVLIALLSPQQGLKRNPDGWYLGEHKLAADIETLIGPEYRVDGFSWQQTLRAVHHHHKDGKLQKLLLIGSHGTAGSGSPGKLRLARDFFAHHFPGVEIMTPGIEDPDQFSPDFENLDATCAALTKGIVQCGAEGGDIIIDITGGQKTASIAATLVTLDRAGLMFQYVGTGASIGKVYGFDVVTERSQS